MPSSQKSALQFGCLWHYLDMKLKIEGFFFYLNAN
jgi:hypothetical protein